MKNGPAYSATGYKHTRFTALTNAFQNVSTGPANFYGWNILNLTASTMYVKFSDTSAGAVGTAAVKFSLLIPASGTAFFELQFPLRFSTQIRAYAVTGAGDADATAPGTAAIVDVFYMD